MLPLKSSSVRTRFAVPAMEALLEKTSEDNDEWDYDCQRSESRPIFGGRKTVAGQPERSYQAQNSATKH